MPRLFFPLTERRNACHARYAPLWPSPQLCSHFFSVSRRNEGLHCRPFVCRHLSICHFFHVVRHPLGVEMSRTEASGILGRRCLCRIVGQNNNNNWRRRRRRRKGTCQTKTMWMWTSSGTFLLCHVDLGSSRICGTFCHEWIDEPSKYCRYCL